MKKKNGFTLIELLVVIALMLSILGIAVVSLINTSNKKKKESWEQVKGQIETAAVEYFTANEYLFEGLQNGSIGTISVGKLVNEDYLNKVTNPDTGKSVSMCALVNITKDGEKYNATFDNTSTENQVVKCESNNIITVSEPGAPEFEIKDVCENKNGSNEKQNGYCYSETFSVDNNKEKYKPHGKIISKKYCVGKGTSCNTDTEFTDSFDGAAETVNNGVVGITLINQSGAKTTKYKDYKIDRTVPKIPEINIISESSGYNTLKPNISVRAEDKESGIGSILTSSNGNEKQSNSDYVSYPITLGNNYDTIHNLNVIAVAYDKVGNSSESRDSSYYTYLKCSQKTESKQSSWNGSCSASCGGGKQYGTTITYYSDKYLSGVSCGNDGGKSDSRSCNTQGCCSSTRVKNYSYGSWSSCSRSCGGGTKTRTKTQNLISSYNGQSCGKGSSTTESQSCNTQSCCNWGGVSITSYTHQTNSNKTKAYSSSVNKLSKATYVDFTFNVPSGMTKVETHAAFCGDYNTCKDINSSNKNQTTVRCTNRTNCSSGWRYVGASVKVKCDGKTKVFNYAHKIGDSNTTWSGWE